MYTQTMNGAFLQTCCLLLHATRCLSLGRFADGDSFREDNARQLNGIVDHCSDQYAYKQLTVVKVGRNLSPEFYRNIHERFSIPVRVLDGTNDPDPDSFGPRSCVILCLAIQRISKFFETVNERAWVPGSLYVIYISEESVTDEEKKFYERVWSLSAADLWRKRFLHKSILSVNGGNLYFDPFEPRKNSGEVGSWEYSSATELAENSFGGIRDLGNSTGVLRARETFDGYEANVTLFPYITAEKDERGSWSGLDAIAMGEICERMNVVPRVFDTPEKFGWSSHGKYYGALGRLLYHRSDLAFNGFFVKNYGTEDLEFSSYLFTDKICVVVPKQPRVPDYLLIVRIFSLDSWLLIFVGNSFLALTYFAMASFDFRLLKGKKLGESFDNFSPRAGGGGNLTRGQRFLATWIFLCFYPVKVDAKLLGERLNVAFGLTLGVVIGGCFTSQLASSFSSPAFLKNINSLAELDDSGLEVLTSFPNLLADTFADNDSSTFRNLHVKLKLKNASEIEKQVLQTRNAGYIDRLHSLILAKKPTDELHVLSEYPHEYPLAYPVAKGSPFLPRMNTIIGRLQNAGLYKKWFSDMMKPSKNDNSQKPVVIRLPHLYIPFLILFAGLGIAGGMFVWELNYPSVNGVEMA